jgi:hypothetical protein
MLRGDGKLARLKHLGRTGVEWLLTRRGLGHVYLILGYLLQS